MISVVLVFSTVLQFGASILALRLIRVTGRRLGWISIAIALTMMGVRRSITLFRHFVQGASLTTDLAAELVALVISALLVAGLSWIAPMFRSFRASEIAQSKANRALRALSQCNQTLIHASSVPELMEQVCRVIVEAGGYRLTWIGRAEKDEEKTVIPIAQWGFESGYLEKTKITWADNEWGRGPTGTAIRTGTLSTARHILTDPEFEPWREQALKRGYASSLALPLIIDGEIFGALNIYAEEPDSFDTEELQLLSEMAADLSYGIEALRTREARDRALNDIRRLRDFNEEILQNLIAGIVVQDADLNFEYVNPAAAAMLDCQPEMLIGKPWRVIVPVDQQHIVDGAVTRRQKGEGGQYELDLQRRDGQRVPVLVSAQPRFVDGQFTGAIVAFTDITERKRAEQALAESQRVLSTLMSNLPGMVYRCKNDPHWTMEFASEGALQLTGYPASDLIMNSVVAYGDLILPEERERVWLEAQAALEREEPFRLIYRIRAENQEVRWVWEQGRGVFNVKGGLTALEGFISDISERIRAEEDVKKRLIELETLNEIITAASAALDLDALTDIALERTFEVLRLEKGAIWIGGYHAVKGLPLEANEETISRLERTGMPLVEPVTVNDWTDLSATNPLSELAAWMGTIEVRSSLFMPIMEEGSVVGALRLDAAEPRRWLEHEISFSNAVAREIGAVAAKLRLLQDNLRQSQQLKRIMDTVQEGIVALTPDRFITLANPVGQEYLAALAADADGGPLTELGGHPLDEILAGHGGGMPVEIVLEGEKEQMFEVFANPSSPDQIGDWTLILRDVTERREAERRVELQNRLAVVGQMAAGIAHDFNNIIAAIILYCGTLLKEPGLSEGNAAKVERIRGQAERAASLVQQILDFSRRTVMQPRPADLVIVLMEFRELISRTFPENITLRLNHAPVEFVVCADPARLEQVLMNLAINARDAMTSGGELRFELSHLVVEEGEQPPYRDMGPGSWIKLEVVDTGEGIPYEILPHIFDPFFTTKPPGEGTGLGLAQVYGIIKQHDGYIDVESQVGSGTRFIIYLPAIDEPGEAGVKETAIDLEQGGSGSILIVEDNEVIQDAMKEILESLGYTVRLAKNGREAIDIYKKGGETIDIVLSDLVMPVMGGMDLYRALSEIRPEVRFVMMTGYPLGMDTRELFDRQAITWVQKPFGPEEIAQVIRQALEGNGEPPDSRS